MNNPLIFYTSTIRYSGDDKLDISAKSSTIGRIFAPTWEMINNVKNNKISEKEYVKLYIDMMKHSYESNNKWEEFLTKDKLVLCCYCPPLTFCHRYILTDIFIKLGCEYKGEIC